MCTLAPDQLSITVSDIPTTELYPVVCMSSAGESVEILPNSMQPGTEKKKSKK
jgi:hypothetical protein